MKKSKGFIYTIFATLIIVSMISLTSFESLKDKSLGINVAEKIKTDETYYFLEGTRQDIERGALITGKRAVLAIIDKLVSSGAYTSNYADEDVTEAAVNGTFNSTVLGLMDGTTMENWSASILGIGNGLNLNVTVDIMNTSTSPYDAFNLVLKNELHLIVRAENMKLGFDKNYSSETVYDVYNMEDPFVTIESYAYLRNILIQCNESLRASKISTGSSSGGVWTSGRAYVSSEADYSGVSNKSDKILIVDNIPEPEPSGISSFEGVVSENASDDNSSLTNYILGASGAFTSISNNSLVVLDSNDVWVNNILDEVTGGCYFEDSDGPSFLDRLEGNFETSSRYLVAGKTVGLGSFVDAVQLPPALQKYDSAVDFVYFNDSLPTVYKIKGVTEKKAGVSEKAWFRLDDTHVNDWGISDLAY